MKPSETQLDLMSGVRAKVEQNAKEDDPGAQVLARIRLQTQDPAIGAARLRTVRETCSVPLDVMAECRRDRRPFPDPHDWRPAPAERVQRSGASATAYGLCSSRSSRCCRT